MTTRLTTSLTGPECDGPNCDELQHWAGCSLYTQTPGVHGRRRVGQPLPRTAGRLADRQIRLAQLIHKQRVWIEAHGLGVGLSGYVMRYGDSYAAGRPKIGDGGQRIYEADMAELRALEAEYAEVRGKQGVR